MLGPCLEVKRTESRPDYAHPVNFLIVCTGNICRSPMAEAMLRRLASEREADDVSVSSSGTWGLDGEKATSLAVEELSSRGIDGSSHIAKSLSRDQLQDADLVIAMTSVHLREIGQMDPTVLGKTVLLKEIPALGAAAGRSDTSRGRLEALLEAKRPEWRRAMDVDDPMGLPSHVYKLTADELWTGLTYLARFLWPEDEEALENP